MKIFADQWTT